MVPPAIIAMVQWVHYEDKETGLIDYDNIKTAIEHNPS